MKALRRMALILSPLFVPPTGRYAAGVARVPLFRGRRLSAFSGEQREEQFLVILSA